ncbi:uncharacterized protein EI90DRAFT_54052 [Cantharellus anzutake]|uniref:uncharacterized protein n=1 Tax=Cantharellus anzutake TaxID=1750568 RepID=UPI0019069257|nr:uncharacterized protein EI90DRAFT_54052 [Cantharellus anzutake]KAF8344175.1 hypothetical protein EI90DRAFT_54052 [Cantharellus anzutake]
MQLSRVLRVGEISLIPHLCLICFSVRPMKLPQSDQSPDRPNPFKPLVMSNYAYLGANAKDAGKVIPKSTKDVDNLNGIATVEATTSVPSKDGCPPGTVPMKQHLRPMLPSSKTGLGAHRSGPLYHPVGVSTQTAPLWSLLRKRKVHRRRLGN